MKAQFFNIEKFGKDKKYTKAIFLLEDSKDKIGLMISDEELATLLIHTGKTGILQMGFSPSTAPKSYDYKLSFTSFKVA